MNRQLELLSSEMNKVSRHKRAATAYRSVPRSAGQSAANM